MIASRNAAAAFTAMFVLTGGPAKAWVEGVCQGVSKVTQPPARSPVPGNRQCGIFLNGAYQTFVIDILENNRGCDFKKSDKICVNQNGHKIIINKYAVTIINPGTKTEMCAADLAHPMPFQILFTSDCKTQLKKR